MGQAPLVRVLAQVKFSKIIKISEESHIGDFQESLRQSYPNLVKDLAKSLEFHIVDGAVTTKSTDEVIWRFLDAHKLWRVSLTPSAITIESMKYTSRDDFLARFKQVLAAVAMQLRPAMATRVGFRYVNRIESKADLAKLQEFIQPELVGIHTGILDGSFIQTFSQVQGKTKEGFIQAKWGLTPAGITHDPDSAPPTQQLSWMLDIDSFRDNSPVEEGFNPEELVGMVDQVANRAYAFFRWSVTDKFLLHFGGTADGI